MRTIRIIPCLDVDKGRVVKGINFVDLRDAGDPVELASAYNDQGADEIVFLISLDILFSENVRFLRAISTFFPTIAFKIGLSFLVLDLTFLFIDLTSLIFSSILFLF